MHSKFFWYTIFLAVRVAQTFYGESNHQQCAIFFSGGRSTKTFKPKKNIPEGTHQYDLMKQAAATLGSGNLRLAVMLPEGEDLNEWVAVNSMFDPFFPSRNLFISSRNNYAFKNSISCSFW